MREVVRRIGAALGLSLILVHYITPGSTPTDQQESKDPYALARTQSFGFFYDVPASSWMRWHQIFIQHENHRFPDKPLTFNPEATADEVRPEKHRNRNNVRAGGLFSYPAWYQMNYEPNFSCPFEMRVGDPMNGDGGKWVCDVHRIKKLAHERKAKDPTHPGCVIYSVGSNGDFTFELGMQKEVGEGTCEYHIFDMGDYASNVPPRLKRAFYHRWGLEEHNASRPSDMFHSLVDTVKMLGHENLDVIDVFKIDCEKCEWKTYADWLSDDIPLLHQILVEVHHAPKDKVLDFFDSIERAGYLRFHKEPNIQFDAGCIEYAFVKVDKIFMEGKNLTRVGR